MASPGEYIINADKSKKIGYNVLDYINSTGEIPGFANGGKLDSIGAGTIGDIREISLGEYTNRSVNDTSPIAPIIKM
jgi:hypothetical protein